MTDPERALRARVKALHDSGEAKRREGALLPPGMSWETWDFLLDLAVEYVGGAMAPPTAALTAEARRAGVRAAWRLADAWAGNPRAGPLLAGTVAQWVQAAFDAALEAP